MHQQSTITPLMKQYQEVKSRHLDCLLFFRMGDFYELFYDDARIASKFLSIALTARNKSDPQSIPMCGVPHHSVKQYIAKLLNGGFKVALCEQLEDASTIDAKAIVKRDVVQIISPGTRFDLECLDEQTANYIHAAFYESSRKNVYWATIDFTTGHFWFDASRSLEAWKQYLVNQPISEVLLSDDRSQEALREALNVDDFSPFIQTVPHFFFDEGYAKGKIKEQFQVEQLSALHPQLTMGFASCAAPVGALIKHFQETQKTTRIHSAIKIEHWKNPDVFELSSTSAESLEVFPPRHQPRSSKNHFSLLSWVDRTQTAVGGRLLKEWLLRPLISVEKIRERQDQVEAFVQNKKYLDPIFTHLKEIYDLERLISRVNLNSNYLIYPRELFALAVSIQKSHALKAYFEQRSPLSETLFNQNLKQALIPSVIELANQTFDCLNEALPPNAREGKIFRKGAYPELDEWIDLCENGEQWLLTYEAQEREKSGIQSLKVKYNRVFGYFIEITKSNLSAVPETYIRKQTMSNGERFITPELKAFEDKMLNAERKRADLELHLFKGLCLRFSQHTPRILSLARAIAEIDVLLGFAVCALEEDCIRPHVDDSTQLQIMEGRHPMVAAALAQTQPPQEFISNNIYLIDQKNFFMITGPNMGGKSTIMRQTALLVLLAQVGAFIPAKSAHIGIVDQIFTRIGAQDRIAEGASTFMVEMSEMSHILRNATSRSLLLIDEIGRGTSTFDGLSLAWAIAEYIAQHLHARTLFSTHYHELTKLGSIYLKIQNMRVGVSVEADPVNPGQQTIRFRYKLEEGISEKSYGLLVAKLAGLPQELLGRANLKLKELEGFSKKHFSAKISAPTPGSVNQLHLDLLESSSASSPSTAQ